MARTAGPTGGRNRPTRKARPHNWTGVVDPTAARLHSVVAHNRARAPRTFRASRQATKLVVMGPATQAPIVYIASTVPASAMSSYRRWTKTVSAIVMVAAGDRARS